MQHNSSTPQPELFTSSLTLSMMPPTVKAMWDILRLAWARPWVALWTPAS